jgi:exopolysaccharide production protein ExoQ
VSTSTRVASTPTWLDSLVFLALMSGPPKFRGRDPSASLTGAIDLVVLVHLAVWACGGLWVLARLYPTVLRRGIVPAVNRAQALGALFIATLALSAWESPGPLLTAFTLGQFAVMLSFIWVFTHRFGTSACLRHLFMGVSLLAATIVAALVLWPELVAGPAAIDTGIVIGQTRLVGNNLTDVGSVAAIGLVFCLSNVPRLRAPVFWGALSLFGGLLVASRTRSADFALLAFLAIGFTQGRGLRVRQLVVPLVLFAFGVFVMDAMTSTTAFLVKPESIGTMSDRIPLWQYLTSIVMREAPLTGLGYFAATRVYAPQYNPGLGNAHSVFFEVLVGGGILGAAAYLVLCGWLVWLAMRLLVLARGRPSAVAATGLLTVALLSGITQVEGIHAGPLGFAFWSMTALLPGLLREASRARTAAVQQPHARNSNLRLRPA